MVNTNDNNSLIMKLRRKRDAIFRELISKETKKLLILDIGGTEIYWENLGYCGDPQYLITIVNLFKIETNCPNIHSLVGDGRDLSRFSDKEFDIVFANSVIEHVGDLSEQKKMADEMRRIGKRYFLQIPHNYIPIEPHYLFPFFQLLPIRYKVALIRHFNLGWFHRERNPIIAKNLAQSVRLLNKRELKMIFPESTIQEEKYLGIPVSFLVYYGF